MLKYSGSLGFSTGHYDTSKIQHASRCSLASEQQHGSQAGRRHQLGAKVTSARKNRTESSITQPSTRGHKDCQPLAALHLRPTHAPPKISPATAPTRAASQRAHQRRTPSLVVAKDALKRAHYAPTRTHDPTRNYSRTLDSGSTGYPSVHTTACPIHTWPLVMPASQSKKAAAFGRLPEPVLRATVSAPPQQPMQIEGAHAHAPRRHRPALAHRLACAYQRAGP